MTYFQITKSQVKYIFNTHPHTPHTHAKENMVVTGYNPASSQISRDTLADFLRAPIDGKLESIYGIKKDGVAAQALQDNGVENSYQLLGVFLKMKSNDTDSKEHCDLFYNWLTKIGVTKYRAAIVRQIAEKTNTWMDGLYDIEE